MELAIKHWEMTIGLIKCFPPDYKIGKEMKGKL